MATYTYIGNASRGVTVDLTSADFNLTAANSNRQNIVLTVPARCAVRSISLEKATTTTGTGLTALNMTAGVSASGTEYLSSTAITNGVVTAMALHSAPTVAPRLTDSQMFVGFAPAGAAWNVSDLNVASLNMTLHVNWASVTDDKIP